MAGTVIDSLVVTMGLDPSEFVKGSKQVEQSVRTMAKAVPNELQQGVTKMAGALSGGIKTMLTQVIGPMAAAFGGLAAVRQYTAQADAIGKLSASIGVNAEAMQAWGEAATRAGGSAQAFYGTLGNLNKTVQTIAATGKGRGQDVLEALGIAVKKDGKAREAFDVLGDLAEAAQKVGTVKFQGLAQRLGLDQGTIMLLQSGREAVTELVEKQAELGGYTAEDMQATADYNDAVADMQQALKATSATILRYVIPPITKMLNAITSVVTSLRKHKGAVIGILTAIGVALKGSVVSGLTAAAAAVKSMAATLAPLAPMIAAVASAALVFDDLAVWLEGGKAALSDFWEAILGKPEEARAEIAAAWEGIKAVTASLWGSIKSFVADLFSALAPLGSAMGPLVDAMTSVVGVVKSLGALMGEIFGMTILDPIKRLFSLISTGTADADGGFSLLRTIVQSVADALTLAAKGVGLMADAFKGAIEWITQGVQKVREFADYLATLSLDKILAVPADWGRGLLEPLGAMKKWLNDFSLVDVLKGWGAAIAAWWDGLIEGIYKKMFDAMPAWMKTALSWVGVDVGSGSSAKMPDPAAVGAAFPAGAAAEVPAAALGSQTSNVDNSKQTTINTGNITIQTQATDPQAIYKDAGTQFGAAVEAAGVGT